MKPKIIKLLIITLTFLTLALLTKISSKIPVTIQEAKESYTAKTIISTGVDTNSQKPGIFFRTDNHYIPAIGVYSRIPPIALFGLNSFSIRIPLIFFGAVAIYLYYLNLKISGYRKSIIYSALFLILFSPYFVQTLLFSVSLVATMAYVLLVLLLYQKKQFLLLALVGSASLLFDFSAIVFALFFLAISLIINYKAKKSFVLLLLAILAILSPLILNQPLRQDLIKNSVVNSILPQSYGYVIGRRLSYDLTFQPQLPLVKYHINRLAFNKPFFTVNEFSKKIVDSFDYEFITSALKSEVIQGPRLKPGISLPKFFFWETPIILLCFILFYIKLPAAWKMFFYAGLIVLIIFPQNYFFQFLPLVTLLESLAIYHIFCRPHHRLIIGLFFVFLYLPSQITQFDFIANQPQQWFDSTDYVQYKIMSHISPQEIQNNRITITNRLGEPVFYYLYYHDIDPNLFLSTRKLGGIVDPGLQRIESIGNVYFRSFQYYESDRQKNQLWIGQEQEFNGPGADFRNNKVVDGDIVNTISNINPPEKSRFFGNQVFFVKTSFTSTKETI